MDSLDLQNMLVLRTDDLPPEVKEILSKVEIGDKVKISNGQFTLVENGEKNVSFAINTGDSLSIEDPTDPEAAPVEFKMGEDDDEETDSDEQEDEDSENPEKSAAVESAQATGPEEEDSESDPDES